MPRDQVKSVFWLRRAAGQGHADAQYALGLAYFEGKGVPRDVAQARSWIEEAAKRGHPEASRALSKGAAPAFGSGEPRKE